MKALKIMLALILVGLLASISWGADLQWDYPTDWNDIDRFIYFAGHVKGLAYALDIGLRWGGDWNMNNDLLDEKSLIDLGHFELIELAV